MPVAVQKAEATSSAVRNNSADSEDTPFDQRSPQARKTTTTMKIPKKKIDDELEDGELPSLTRDAKQPAGRMVNGQRTTTRPLSPPSQAGLHIPDAYKHRQFWGQFDYDDSDGREEGPDDEMAARGGAKRKASSASPNRSSSPTEVLEIAPSRSVSTEGTGQEGPDFCAQTLEAIGDMCGAGMSLSDSPKKTSNQKAIQDRPEVKSDKPKPRRSIGNGSVKPEEQEEHTAIEVEFVEPEPKMSPRKHTYLTGLAKRAKEDYGKKQVDYESSSEKSDPSLTSDVYHAFTASEKRKFLKLINSGISPAEASWQVAAERKQKDEHRIANDAAMMKAGRASRLGFWKKAQPSKSSSVDGSADEDDEPDPPTSAKEEDLVEAAPESEETLTPVKLNKACDETLPQSDSEDDRVAFVRSGINYYDAIRKDATDDDISEGEVLDTLAGRASLGKPLQHAAATLRTGPLARGFAKLAEDRRSKSVPRARVPSEDSSSERPPLGPTTRKNVPDVESEFAGTLAVAETPEVSKSVAAVPRTVQNLKESTQVSADATEAVDELEKSLLRPVPNEDHAKSTTTQSTAVKASDVAASTHDFSQKRILAQQAQLLNQLKRQSKDHAEALPPQSTKPTGSTVSIDVNMNAYFSSTDSYASQSGTAAVDNMSVYSGATGVTGATAMTQSSRVRRPGAAKSRLEKSKLLNGAPSRMGWHESIRAVAASTHREWDPENGWKDFKDSVAAIEHNTSKEKIHLNLQKSIKHSNAAERFSKEEGDPVIVPFPPDWETERAGMLSPESVDNRKHREHSSDGGTSQTYTPSRPSGWVESMPAATAAIATEGRKCRPESGWNDISSQPDSVDFTNDEVREDEKKDQDVAALREDSPHNLRLEAPRPPASRVKKIPAKPERDVHGIGTRDVHSADDTDDDSYMQLGDNGSVRSLTMDSPPSPVRAKTGEKTLLHAETQTLLHAETQPPPAAPVVYSTAPMQLATQMKPATKNRIHGPGISENYISDDDEDEQPPLLNDSESFPAVAPIQDLQSSMTDVVIEKVREDELKLFHHFESKEVLTGSKLAPHRTTEPASLASKRSPGPVDMDEVGESSDDSEEEPASRTETSSSSSPSKGGSSGFYDRSASTSQSPSRKIPLLQRSKRDTSPIVVRKAPFSDPMSQSSGRERRTSKAPVPVTPDALTNAHVSRPAKERYDKPGEKTTSTVNMKRELRDEGVGTGKQVTSEASAEWKAFLGKKVLAESYVASKKGSGPQGRTEPEGQKWSYHELLAIQSLERKGRSDDDDTLFEFREKNRKSDQETDESALAMSELSPVDTKSDSDKDISEAYGPDPDDRPSFFRRLTECATPIMPTVRPEGESLPMAHLAFLRSTAQATGSATYVPTSICGRPECVYDDVDGEESVKSEELEASQEVSHGKLHPGDTENRPRSTGRPRSNGRGREVRSTGSSVVSGEFGAKTAYLEAIAMKAAVSKPRRSDSRRRGRSSESSVGSNSSAHSEKWQAFLERKRSSTASPPKARGVDSSDISIAAGRYAVGRVQEIMASKAQANVRKPQPEAFSDPKSEGAPRRPTNKSASVVAAQDLAAARVEAMMEALSNSHFEEGEI